MSDPVEIQEKFLEVNGKKIHYLEAGEGTPIVLIHGWLASSNGFSKIIPELSKKFHVLAPDLPGCGYQHPSEQLDGEHTLAAYVKFLSSFIENMGLKKVGVLGLSMGGTLALEWARRFPEEIKKVAVFEPVLESRELSWVARILCWAAYWLTPLRRLVRWLMAQGAKRESFIDTLSPKDQTEILEEIYGGDLRAAAESSWDLLKGVNIDHYRSINKPVLLVCGGHKTSISSPGSIDKLAQILPNAKVEKLNSGNHNLIREDDQVPVFAKALSNLFSS